MTIDHKRNGKSAKKQQAKPPDYRVTDDLPRPLPIVPGEGQIVRMLLGDGFREILFGKS